MVYEHLKQFCSNKDSWSCLLPGPPTSFCSLCWWRYHHSQETQPRMWVTTPPAAPLSGSTIMFVPKPYFPQAAPRTNADPFLHDVALLPWVTVAQGLPFSTDQTFLDLRYSVTFFYPTKPSICLSPSIRVETASQSKGPLAFSSSHHQSISNISNIVLVTTSW